MTSAARPNFPPYTCLNNKILKTGRLPAASATAIQTAKNLDTIVAGVPFAPTTTKVPGMSGRNVKIVIVDANNSSNTRWKVEGTDHFDSPQTEFLPSPTTSQVGAGTLTGARIFKTVTQVTQDRAGEVGAAADNITIGTGDIVGLPEMCSIDGHEYKDAQLVAANNTTIAVKAVNSTNFDFTNFALLAAFFGGTVTAGDEAEVQFVADPLTPDDKTRFPPRV